MRGDAEYGNQHQHGVKESAKPATGVHLMSRGKPAESKEIKAVSTSFRGHMLLSFADGTTHELQRGDYPHNVAPKVGEFYPPLSLEAGTVIEMPNGDMLVVRDGLASPVEPKLDEALAEKPEENPEQPADNAQS